VGTEAVMVGLDGDKIIGMETRQFTTSFSTGKHLVIISLSQTC